MILVGPKNKDTALKLLAAADKLELGPSVVKATLNGFLVPEEVAAEMEAADAAEMAPAQPKSTRSKKATAAAKADDTKEGKE